jgi:hypothetical protein
VDGGGGGGGVGNSMGLTAEEHAMLQNSTKVGPALQVCSIPSTANSHDRQAMHTIDPLQPPALAACQMLQTIDPKLEIRKRALLKPPLSGTGKHVRGPACLGGSE